MPWASGAVSSSGCDLETDRRASRLVIEVGPAIVDALLEVRRNASFRIEVRKPGVNCGSTRFVRSPMM